MNLVKAFLIIAALSFNFYAQNNRINQIDSLMNEAHRIGVFNGNVVVIEKDKVIYQAAIGYADGSKTKKLSLDLRFDIGSIAKEFNGAAIMMLKEQGKLNLEDKVSKYLSDLPNWADKVQIKHLLQYTSGLPNTRAPEDDDVKKELLQLTKLEFEPGTAFIYSYNNVYLQRRIIEKISGLSYKKFVESKVFKPCRMLNAKIDSPIDAPQNAKAFDNEFVESKNIQLISGGVMLNTEDMYQWTKCLHSFEIIKEKSFAELSEGFPNSETSLGSTKYENNKLISHQHQGSNFNFEALIYSDLVKEISIILLTNNQNLKVFGLRDAILAILNDKPYQVPKKSIYLDIREKVLKDFDKGIDFYTQLKTTQPDKYDLANEVYELINTGKYLQRRERFADAVKLFHLAADLSVKKETLSNCFELTADSYLKEGQKSMATIYYKKALEQNEANKNAKGKLDEVLNSKK